MSRWSLPQRSPPSPEPPFSPDPFFPDPLMPPSPHSPIPSYPRPPIPQDLKEGPPAEWTVEEQGGTIDAVLKRTYQGEAISVVAAFADDDEAYPEEGEGESEEEEEGEEEERLTPLSVRVTVAKKADQGELEIDCVVDGNSWIIQDVRLEDPDVPEDGIPYGGPQFSTLDPVLQEQFDSFLRRRGISAGLAAYLRRYLEDKEQREYVRWLKRLGAFVAQK
ncbi:unnamed protein product [Closterium sp. Naga37s-1]|nr:unnamed protein product [Closterium sp. Naga37s-1]